MVNNQTMQVNDLFFLKKKELIVTEGVGTCFGILN
jgi:hypothetical protein